MDIQTKYVVERLCSVNAEWALNRLANGAQRAEIDELRRELTEARAEIDLLAKALVKLSSAVVWKFPARESQETSPDEPRLKAQ